MSVAIKTNPKLWEKSKKRALKRMGGKHSARAMQLAVKYYKDAGGTYKGKKSRKTNSLSKWTKQKWRTSDNTRSLGKKRYLPDKAWKHLSPSEKRKTNKYKLAGWKKGKQYVKQPRSIAKKTSRYRKK